MENYLQNLFLPIYNFEEFYEINFYGKIKNKKTGNFLKINSKNQVKLYKNGIGYDFNVNDLLNVFDDFKVKLNETDEEKQQRITNNYMAGFQLKFITDSFQHEVQFAKYKMGVAKPLELNKNK